MKGFNMYNKENWKKYMNLVKICKENKSKGECHRDSDCSNCNVKKKIIRGDEK